MGAWQVHPAFTVDVRCCHAGSPHASGRTGDSRIAAGSGSGTLKCCCPARRPVFVLGTLSGRRVRGSSPRLTTPSAPAGFGSAARSRSVEHLLGTAPRFAPSCEGVEARAHEPTRIGGAEVASEGFRAAMSEFGAVSPLVNGSYPGGDGASSGRTKKNHPRFQTGPETCA